MDSSGKTYVLDEGALVLEGVTLAQVVQLVVQVLVDLALGAVADKEATEDTHAAHPQDVAKGLSATRSHVSSSISAINSMVQPQNHDEIQRHKQGMHTWAYGRPWYPCAYPDPCVG